MNRKLVILAFMAALMVPGLGVAGGVTKEDFEVETTRDLLNLCRVSPSDPLSREAIHFCEGYLVGAYDYYVAANSGPEGERLVCLPDPPPSRDAATLHLIC